MVTLVSVGVVLPVNFQVNNFSGVYFQGFIFFTFQGFIFFRNTQMIFEDFGGKKNWTAIKTMFHFLLVFFLLPKNFFIFLKLGINKTYKEHLNTYILL